MNAEEVGPCDTLENIILYCKIINKLSNVYEILSSVASN
jgi:hypothetical protein